MNLVSVLHQSYAPLSWKRSVALKDLQSEQQPKRHRVPLRMRALGFHVSGHDADVGPWAPRNDQAYQVPFCNQHPPLKCLLGHVLPNKSSRPPGDLRTRSPRLKNQFSQYELNRNKARERMVKTLTMEIDMYWIWTLPERRRPRIGVIAPRRKDVSIFGLDLDILDSRTPTKVIAPWTCVFMWKGSDLFEGNVVGCRLRT